MKLLSTKNWREFVFPKINPVIANLIYSDVLLVSGIGLVSPFFAIFLTQQIKGGNIEIAGIATTIFLVTRSVGQIPISWVLDKIKGELDDYAGLLISTIFQSLIYFLYIFINQPWQIFVIEFFAGLLSSISLSAWLAIFSRHIDHNKEGLEWGIYNTLTDIGSAITAGVGGVIVQNFGFRFIFIFVGIISILGSLLILRIKPHIKKIS